jgi:vitamin B12 transporter
MDRYHTILHRAGLAAVIGALAPAVPALAQAVTELEGIIIEGASLSGEPADAATLGSAVTVITGEDLERRQIRHAADALRTVPGLAVSRVGGVGSQTQVRVRGAEANQLKVILDGVEVNSLDAGDFQFETLLVVDIERIEVIRGPQSGIYGANALAGVINIITRKAAREPRVAVETELGGLGTRALSANASGAGEHGYLSISAARRETDGFNIARTGSESDGSTQQTIFARAGFMPTDYFRIDVMGRYQENDAHIDPFDPPVDTPGVINRREQTLGRIAAELDTFGKAWSHKVFADYFRDDFFSINPSSFFAPGPFTNDGERSRYGYLTTFRFDLGGLGSHSVTGLAEQIDESFAGRGLEQFGFGLRPTIASRANTGYAAEYKGSFDETVFISGNIRYDDKETFEDATSYRLAGAYLVRETGTRFHASYGKGITDPTFFQQFGSSESFKGNPNLTPEESIGWDIGVEQKFWDNRITVDVTYFQADLSDEITSSFGVIDVDGDGIPDDTVINQTGKSQRQGVEVSLAAQIMPSLLITGSYTYLYATEPDGSQEIRRPRHSGALGIAYSFADGRGRINADAVYNGDMKDRNFGLFPAPLVTLDDYLLVNIAASYKLDDTLELFGRVENILDQNYEEVFGYSAAPIVAYAGLRMSLGAESAALEAASLK